MAFFYHCCAQPVPGAELMGSSDQQSLKVVFSGSPYDCFGITEFSSNLYPSQLSFLLHSVIKAEEVKMF